MQFNNQELDFDYNYYSFLMIICKFYFRKIKILICSS